MYVFLPLKNTLTLVFVQFFLKDSGGFAVTVFEGAPSSFGEEEKDLH